MIFVSSVRTAIAQSIHWENFCDSSKNREAFSRVAFVVYGISSSYVANLHLFSVL